MAKAHTILSRGAILAGIFILLLGQTAAAPADLTRGQQRIGRGARQDQLSVPAPRYITSGVVNNNCNAPLKVDATYSTFGYEQNPLHIIAVVQPGKALNLPEQTKDQGTWVSVFQIPKVEVLSVGPSPASSVTVNEGDFDIDGVTKGYVFDVTCGAANTIKIDHHTSQESV